MKLLKSIISISLLTFVFSCSGTGTKDLGLVLPQIDEKDNNKVFISNVSSWEGILSNFKILLNGQSIGILGTDEILVGNGKDGKNTLKVVGKTYQLMGDSNTYIFDNENKENRFFTVNINQKILHSIPLLNEVTKQSFMNNVR